MIKVQRQTNSCIIIVTVIVRMSSLGAHYTEPPKKVLGRRFLCLNYQVNGNEISPLKILKAFLHNLCNIKVQLFLLQRFLGFLNIFKNMYIRKLKCHKARCSSTLKLPVN